MLFNSLIFALFLPIVFLLYWFVFGRNLKLQNLFVVVASYTFYGWWDWRFLFLIAFTSFCSWGSGLLIEKYRETPKKAKTINVLNIVLNLLILGVFKYYDFFVTSFANLFLEVGLSPEIGEYHHDGIAGQMGNGGTPIADNGYESEEAE